ncbi:nucleotide exchange factor GrpE [Natrinema longum]|uniref:Protein GrpE n=1 Tax=Natrinema longum TaxID=370324 RepID=A0A8A2UBL2_9EURY|nr:nucleotide exchange factor GrpE [Natrinema longum]MBZ6496069.1 nucleotide exchange factor GrpE [Natrinema longum]QSW86003.1 nucleotide exchange factor GrpE [Natrinema longum]
MSEDEGTNTSAQGVPSEEESDDGEAADVNSAESTAGESDPSPETDDSSSEPPAPAADSSVDTAGGAEAEATDEPTPADDASGDGPETGEDVQRVLDRVTEYDDELAHKVNSIVEEAQALNGTVAHQREELEDLTERIESQAETIGELQDELEEYEQALTDRDDRLEEYEAEVEDLKSRLKRKQADFQNYKKRAKKRQQQIKDRAAEDLVERLIGVRDNLKRALEEDSGDAESLREGVEMTLREFDRILEDENVSEIDPQPGTETDPQRHEVMMQVDSDQPEGTIADVYTPGYEMGDKVIQNAQVTVSNGEHADSGGDEDAAESADHAGGAGTDDDTADEDDAAIELGGEVDSDESVDTPADETDD